MQKVSIVTLNFNSEEETHNCIASLQKMKHEKIEMEIIVVDNASQELFALKKEEKAVVIRSEVNLGFTGGNNLGINYATNHGCDYILLLNNDTIVDENLLNELVSTLESDQRIGLLCPKIYFAKGHEYHKKRYKKKEMGNVIWFAGGGIDWQNGVSFHKGMDEVDRGQYDKKEEISFSSGCCMLIKKSLIEQIGMFDDVYYLYYEDADLCLRIQKAGYKIVYEPKGKLWHLNAASSGTGSELHDYYLTRNKIIFNLKYAGLKTKMAILKEALRLFFKGRKWQRRGVIDFFLLRFGKGSFSL